MPFKCIFDYNKTIPNLIPGYLVIQPSEKNVEMKSQWEQLPRIVKDNADQTSRTALQVVDCLLIVRNKSSLRDNTEKPMNNRADALSSKKKCIMQKLNDLITSKSKSKKLKKKSKLTKEDLLRLKNFKSTASEPSYLKTQKTEGTVNELPEAEYIVGLDESSAETQSKKSKHYPSSKNTTSPPIYYRSTQQDKLHKTQKYSKKTKFVTSKKKSEDISSSKQRIKRFKIADDGTKIPVYYRSTEIDRLFNAGKYPKTRKIVSSKKKTTKNLIKNALHADEANPILIDHETVTSHANQNFEEPNNLEGLKRMEQINVYTSSSKEILDNEILSRESMKEKEVNYKNVLGKRWDGNGNWDSEALTTEFSQSQILWSTDSDNEITGSESFDVDGFYCSKSMENGDLNDKIVCKKSSNIESVVKMLIK
ncbi:titin homolog isoform X2 [Eurosta solidaginis]